MQARDGFGCAGIEKDEEAAGHGGLEEMDSVAAARVTAQRTAAFRHLEVPRRAMETVAVGEVVDPTSAEVGRGSRREAFARLPRQGRGWMTSASGRAECQWAFLASATARSEPAEVAAERSRPGSRLWTSVAASYSVAGSN